MELTGPLCRAARVLIEWPRARLAEICGVSKAAVREFETAGIDPGADVKAKIKQALEQGGAVFLEEGDMGAGVRLRHTKKDVRALNRLESEGGPVGEDDV
ncbi:MAG TPA: helix-turn-helix transcriptional regulator [Terricaulis sp.]|nr:helix-turn-helix transcriptional regulator [Terricaulis sp.]